MKDRARPADDGEGVLVLEHITKTFGRVRALDDVSMSVRRGTVHALLGENGAGKTTLMRIAFGLISPDAGTVWLGAKPARSVSTAGAIAAGLGMVHQHFMNVPAMTVAENVALGQRGRFRAAEAAGQVSDIAARTGLALDPAAIAGDLPVGAQQRLEIVKALSKNARTLILDEPTAVLAPSEAADLLSWLRAFANAGNAVVLITHKLRDALTVADDVTVLRRGRVVLAARTQDVSIGVLTEALLGERDVSIDLTHQGEARRRGDIVARLDNVTVRERRGITALTGATVEVFRGEVLGVAGVEGAGQRALLRVLAGRLRPTAGTADLPRAIAFVPEDRHRDALILDFTITDNLGLRGAGSRRGRFAPRSLEQHARALLQAFDVRGGSPRTHARSLSGGNQQKLVLARELSDAPDLVVAENPTRGLDIRATHDVLARLREAARHGAAVVMYSADLDEVLSLSDRVIAIHAGIVRECGLDRDAVGRAMLGVA